MAPPKTARKRAAAKAEVDESAAGKRAAVKAANETLGQDIKTMRDDDGKKFSEISEELGIASGKVLFLYACASVKPKDKIKWKTDDELASGIVSARDDDGLSWGLISARAGVPESRVRKVYTDTTGKSTLGMSIGKGGRKPANGKPVARPGKAAASAKAKATAAKPAAKPAVAKKKVAVKVKRKPA